MHLPWNKKFTFNLPNGHTHDIYARNETLAWRKMKALVIRHMFGGMAFIYYEEPVIRAMRKISLATEGGGG